MQLYFETITSHIDKIQTVTLNICQGCLNLTGKMCDNPECVFCRRTTSEIATFLSVLFIRPIIDGVQIPAIITTEAQVHYDRPGAEAQMQKMGKGYIQFISEAKDISNRQIRWWKGVLLKQLEADTGISKDEWEFTLKFSIMPEKFKPKGIVVNGAAYNIVPSITVLSVKQMNDMIKRSVQWLREHPAGPKLDWVTEPDSDLRI